MDPADPRRAAAVPVPGGGRRLDRFLAFRAAVLPLCRDHARPRPLSDLRRVQGIAAIAVTHSRAFACAPIRYIVGRARAREHAGEGIMRKLVVTFAIVCGTALGASLMPAEAETFRQG